MKFGEFREAMYNTSRNGDWDSVLNSKTKFKVGDKVTYAKGEPGHAQGTIERIKHTHHGELYYMRITKSVGKYATTAGDTIEGEGEDFTSGHH